MVKNNIKLQASNQKIIPMQTIMLTDNKANKVEAARKRK